MKTAKLIIGILLITIPAILFSICSMGLMLEEIEEESIKYLFYFIIAIIIGIYLVSSSNTNDNKKETYVQHQYTEEERKIYFRNADYKAKPITEYQMDERTKMITYYDRMPFSYQKKLSDYADTLYRRYENEEYLKK